MVECSSGYVISEGEVFVEYRCEGDVWILNWKFCLGKNLIVILYIIVFDLYYNENFILENCYFIL